MKRSLEAVVATLLLEANPEERDTAVDMNLRGAFFCICAAGRHFVDRGRQGRLRLCRDRHERDGRRETERGDRRADYGPQDGPCGGTRSASGLPRFGSFRFHSRREACLRRWSGRQMTPRAYDAAMGRRTLAERCRAAGVTPSCFTRTADIAREVVFSQARAKHQ